MKSILILGLLTNLLLSNDFYYEYGKKIELLNNSTTKLLSNNSIAKIYTTTKGKSLIFKDEIIVRCKENKICDNDIELFNLKKIIKRSNDYFLLQINSNQNIFTIMQELHKKENILSAHPNYLIKKKIR